MDAFKEEQEYLANTLEIIDKEIEKSNKELNDLINTGKSLSFEDRKRGEHFNVNSQADMASKKIAVLQRSKPIPYFGRMDISFNGREEEKIYIGRSGISSDGKRVVTDWRAPVSSIYYDGEVGNVSYDTPEGEIFADLSLKRQINIKDSKLIDVQDSSLVTNDDILKPYLEANADNKMKTIIASIQKEQNTIIRKPSNRDMIIQGVAGSGKTSVALHRIAYLVYELGEKISSDLFLVIGPNDYFLNYVSSILPDLETAPVQEETFLNYARDYTGDKINLREEKKFKDQFSDDSFKNIQALKTSLRYKELLDDFMDIYLQKYIIPCDFKVLDEVIFTKERMMIYLFSLNPKFPNYERLTQLLINELKNNLDEIYNRVNAKYKAVYLNLGFDDPVRKEIVQYSSNLYRLLKDDGAKLIRKFVKEIKLSTLNVYSLFISNLNNIDLSLNEKDMLLLQKITLDDLKKRKVGFEDVPALIHISYRLTNKTNNYRQLIIDEAQDYGLFHFVTLKETNPNTNFAIYGDLAQAIYSYRSINNWEEVNEHILENKAEILKLKKSYRTTIEITKNANEILKKMELNEAEPVIRHGVDVQFWDTAIYKSCKIEQIKIIKEKEYKTIAIICKTDKEVKMVYKELKDFGIIAKMITDKEVKYEGGLFVLTAAAAKGLEFDSVIINDASETIYNSNSDIDMHLLYVASTRALHELCILYDKELTSVYNCFIDKNNKKEDTKKLKVRKK